MERIDKKRLEVSICYLERMTEGHNPVNNTPINNDSIIKDENVVRCLCFIKDTLEILYKNEGYIGRIPRKIRNEDKQPFPLESLEGFVYSRDKSIMEFLEQLNCVIDIDRYQKLTPGDITKWLIREGFLRKDIIEEGNRKSTISTNKGKEIGIRTIIRTSSKGIKSGYPLYGKKAQEFIVANMSEILKGR